MLHSPKVLVGVLIAALAATGCPRRGPDRAPVGGNLPPLQECARIAGWLASGQQEHLSQACQRLGAIVTREAEAGGILWIAPAGRSKPPAREALAAALSGVYETKAQPVPVPPGLLPVAGRLEHEPAALAQGLGQAFAASAVAWSDPQGDRIAPVMPLTTRLTLGAPGGLATAPDPARAAAAAVLAHQADAAFARADFAGACILGRAALERMPAEGGCSIRGPIRYLIWKAASNGGCELSEAFDQLEAGCLKAEVPASERAAQAFYSVLVDLESKRGSGWSKEEFPEAWAARKDRQAALAALRVRAEPLTGPRRELIRGLIDEVEFFALRPRGPCDDETPARRKAGLARVAELLHRLGRADLSSHTPGGKPVPKSGAVDPVYLKRQHEDALAPENRWRRKALLGSLLMEVWAAFNTNPDPALTRPLCKDYFDELARLVEQDTWPDRADRSLGLLSGSFLSAAACPDRTSLQALFRKVIDQAGQGERGKLGVLTALSSLLPGLFEAVMSGQQTRLLATLEQMHLAVEGRMQGLSDSIEDRALGASLQAFLAIRPLLQGRLDLVVDRFDQAERELSKLPFPPPEDAPLLVRLAPGLHLAAGYLLIASYALSGQDPLVAPLLARMRPGLKRDLTYSLRALDAGQHAPATVAVALALQGLLEYWASDDDPSAAARLAEAAAGIERAWPKLPEKGGGWWQIGLLSANLALNDYLAVAYQKELGGDTGIRMLARGGLELSQLCDRVQAWFALDGPDFDFVRVLPLAHSVLERALILPEDRADRWTQALLSIEPDLDETLAGLAPKRSPETRMTYLVERGSLPGLLMEAVWIAHEVGWKKLVRAEAGAPQSLLDRLEKIDGRLAGAGRVELKLLMDLMLGGLFELSGQSDQASQWLTRAGGDLDDTDLADATPYVLASRAAVVAETDGPAARRLLREAMAPSREAKKCKRTHPTDALGPAQAWLAARAGQTELALAQLSAYLERVAAGSEGEGRLKCQYMFHGDQLIVQTTVEVTLGNLLQSTSSDSTWQVGAGASSVATDMESLVCVDQPFGYRRHDKQLSAELTAAIYALLAGDDTAADRYLRMALVTNRKIDHGSRATLEVFDADGLEEAREKRYIPLMFWAGVLAQLRGHTEIGENLELRAGRVSFDEGEEQLGVIGLEEGEFPAYLAGVPGVAELRPLLLRWYHDWVRRKGPSKELLQEIAAAAKAHPKAIPAWSPILIRANWLTGEGKLDEAFEALKACSPDDRRNPRLDLLLATLGQLLKKVDVDAGGAAATLERAVAAGYLPEALKAADVLGPGLVDKDGSAAAERLDKALRSTRPEAMDPYTAGQADLLLARVYLAKNDLARARAYLVANLERHNGLFPLQQQLGREWEVIFLGLKLGQHQATLERIQARLPLFGRALGFDSQAVLELEARTLALQVVLSKDYDPRQIDRLLARAAPFGAAVEATSKFLGTLKAALADGKDPVPVCNDYLKT